MEKTFTIKKRIISFIMALLMVFSSFIYIGEHKAEAAMNLALNSNNWRGWYESYVHPAVTTSNYQGMINLGLNPLSVSSGMIYSTDRHTAAGYDDFVAVASNGSTAPAGYSITVNIRTGYNAFGDAAYKPYISDGGGHGSFCIGIMNTDTPGGTAFTTGYWAYGVMYGFYDTDGYTLTFKADAGSTKYYDRCVIYKGSTTAVAEVDLTANLVMADGTADTTVKLVKNDDDYDIVVSNSNGLTKTLYTITDFSEDQKLYYGVGAFCCSQNGGAYIQTSPGFIVKSVSDCEGAHSPASFTGDGSHNYDWVVTDNYKYQVCQNSNCGAIGNKRYEIYYDANGGSGAPDDAYMDVDCNNNPEANVTFTVSSTKPTRAGYSFTGWMIQSNDSAVDSTIVQPGSKVKTKYHCTFVAQWTEGTYTLTLDPDGGTIASGYSTTYSFKTNQKLADKIGGFPTATKTGYTFNGWKLLSSGEHWTDDWGTQPFTWGQNVTFVAQWTANKYTVSYDVNGNTQITCDTTPKTVTFGQQYGTLPAASRVGYTFDGWYTSATGGTRITASSIVSTASNHTLYAHWTAKTYTLTLALAGGEMTGSYKTSYSIKQDELFADVIGGFPAPIKRGYLFNGWKNTATGEHWTGGWGTQPFTYGANTTITAQWVEDPNFKPYYLIFDVNGGNMTSNHATTYGIATGDKYVDILGTIPTAARTGYTFDGWYSAKYNYTLEIGGTFTAAEDVTLVAQWVPVQSVVTLNLNDTTGTKAECSVSSITVAYDSTYSALPAPTRTGYTFNGWFTAATGGTQVTSSTKVTITSNQTLYAHWTAKSYTLTFVLQGGTQQSGYAESYTFLADQSFNEVIGGFPIPTRTGYDFRYWQWSNHTDHCWETEWGANQTYYFGQNITVYARWDAATYTVTFNKNASDATLTTTSVTVTYGKEYGTLPEPSRGDEYLFDGWFTQAEGGTRVTSTTIVTATSNHTLYAHWLDAASYTITFNSNGYLNAQNNMVPTPVSVSGTSLPGGGTTASFNISKNQKFADAVGHSAYFPTHANWTFVGWKAEYNDSNGKEAFVILSSDNWTTAVFDGASDVMCTAYYQCLHSTFNNAINSWVETQDRVIGKCRVCGYDGAYGYRINFLARYNNKEDILLSFGVPQDELFTIDNVYVNGYAGPSCLYDSVNGIIIDFLDITAYSPIVTIQFNPILIAAHDRDAGWLGWSVEGKSLTPQKHMQIIFDQSNSEWNHHLYLRSEYETGYHEIVFNAGNGLKGEDVNTVFGAIPNNGVLVDMNRRYGVIPIRDGQSYHSAMNYIPQAKHIGNYHYPDPTVSSYYNPIRFSNGNFHSYSNSANTLYVSIGWTESDNFAGTTDPLRTQSMMNAWHGGEVINSTTCHKEYNFGKDIQLSAWYFSQPRYGDNGTDVQDDGVAQGYLTTFYANNKGASDDYNDAYYDPDEKSGGTMYYMYKKSGSTYTCTPIFGFDRNDYGSDTYIFEPSPEQYTYDFNITAYDNDNVKYFDTYSAIIAKEPKRYTYYMGEGDHYVFPTVVADPQGVSYEPYEKENGFEYYELDENGKKVYFDNISDPGYDMITDNNGNTYYNSLPSDKNRFKLSRTSNGVPVCNLYTQNATWEGYNVVGGSLPLGFPGISYYIGGNKALYTPVQPHGNAMTYFLTALDYQDYGNMYGSGIPMTYPDGNQYVSMYPTLLARNLPMQACYYTQWDFEVEFNANYPTGQVHDNTVGYPTSLASGKTANVDENGNHFVYGFFDSFSNTPGLNNKMFTCEDYVIDGWQLYNQDGVPVIYDHDYDNSTDGVHLIIDTIDKKPEDPKGLSQKDYMCFANDYSVSIYDAYIYAREPGCEFRAIWKRVYNYTLIEDEAGKGAEYFANVKYKDRFDDDCNVKLTETTTLKVCPNTNVTVSAISASSGYSYEYLTLNNQKYPTVPGRIITNDDSYSFLILGDTTMTAQFVSNSSTAKLMLDRNNWTLNKWSWRLYTSYKAMRDSSNSFYASSLSPSYALYKKGTTAYTVTVTGSTFADVNTTYEAKYDELITLMTASKKGSSQFVGWQADGVFVSYDPIFDYRVIGTAAVTAVYSGTKDASVSISSISSNGDSREAFTASHVAPEGYTLIEAGFLVSTTEHSFTENDISECTSSSNYEKIVSSNQSADGVFKLLYAAGTRYAAAYVYYYDKNGNIVCRISDTIKQ
ncbi:MAG: hypothetical protein E7591_06565 [Ruminococcaceae bacterium]|nr:hypothetical protein [Oscillospiraceae bacterium]